VTTPDIHAVIAELASLGITAEASEPMADDGSDDFCSLYIDPRHLLGSDAVGMCVGWDGDNGWTFADWCDPPSASDNTSYLDPAEPARPREVAERVKAILDGAVDEFRPIPVCPCTGPHPEASCHLHGVAALLRLTGEVW
jgi:hypothetical protein